MLSFRTVACAAAFAAGVMAIHNSIQAAPMENPSATSTTVYVGTYTGKGSDGIYQFMLDKTAAELKPVGLAASIANPSFLASAPDGKYLVCCNEISDFNGKKQGAATSFAVDAATGKLKQTGQAASGGRGPCYVSVTPDGKAVLLANYGSGSVASVPFDAASGDLVDKPVVAQHEGASGVVEKRQSAPHAHCILAGPGGKFAYAVDLGLDEIIAYPLSSSGAIDPEKGMVNKTDPGAGPRHIAFHPNGQFAFSSNELNSTITSWKIDNESGKLEKITSVGTLPEDFSGDNFPAEVLVHPSGKFAYLSNRGHNSVAVFSVEPETGGVKLITTVATRGDHPRGMALSPEGDFLLVANQNSDSLVTYRVNPETGIPEFATEYKGISKPTGFGFLK